MDVPVAKRVPDAQIEALAAFLEGASVAVLTGAGCSTESGMMMSFRFPPS